MSDGGVLFSVHCFLGGFGPPLFVLSLFVSVANVGDGSGMPGEPVIAYKKKLLADVGKGCMVGLVLVARPASSSALSLPS